MRLQEIHAGGGDLQAALIVVGDEGALFQIPEREVHGFDVGLQHVFQLAHGERGSGGPGAAAIVEDAEDGSAQADLLAEDFEELHTREHGAAAVAGNTLDLVELLAQLRIGKRFIRAVNDFKLGGICCFAVIGSILFDQL